MHLNLVRSCETPSDPTRCPLPPWHPARPDRGLSCWCGWCGSLLCTCTRAALLGFVRLAARCCWFAWLRAALRVICFFSLASLAALRCYSVPLQALRMLRPAALIVSHLVRLCWFAAGSFLFCFNASQCIGVSLRLSSLAALLLCSVPAAGLCSCWFLLLLCTL